MKTLLTVLLVIFMNGILLAQTNQPSDSKTKKPALEKGQQLENFQIGKQKFKPKISLQQALKVAEDYVAKEKIDVSGFYLYQARYIMYGAKENQQPAWLFSWVNENNALGNYIEIAVSIETGSASRIPSM